LLSRVGRMVHGPPWCRTKLHSQASRLFVKAL
jgi:hypothetical protein